MNYITIEIDSAILYIKKQSKEKLNILHIGNSFIVNNTLIGNEWTTIPNNDTSAKW